jgi:hypothetical protein
MTTVSPLAILSPGDFVQETIFPSVIVELRAGINTSWIMEKKSDSRTMDRFLVYLQLGQEKRQKAGGRGQKGFKL